MAWCVVASTLNNKAQERERERIGAEQKRNIEATVETFRSEMLTSVTDDASVMRSNAGRSMVWSPDRPAAGASGQASDSVRKFAAAVDELSASISQIACRSCIAYGLGHFIRI